ncbi:DEAD/DEAH box helicase [Bernardetia sp.]|uniref:DEAD/DEAH box helicase n=1 Tax=Bernardetia sp. TaxID=1937974 RepID=UPI0025BB0CB8|nr:DEAD/DEAH box helicase [Bernardetia sp.]
MAKGFGKTWWGQKWLEAFTDIDDTGRLTRGKTYARNGSIQQKVIRGTAIEAKVKGSQASAYSTYVEMKAFTENDKKIILELLQRKPELWQQLTQRQLPKELFNFLEQEDINLFPKRWRDFRAACSCPDFAMPCKHIAALIYSFSEEVDANPFLIFLLHDFDLLSYIEENAQKQKMASMPKWEEKWLHSDEIIELPHPKPVQELDISFAQISNLEQTLLQLLSPNPPFFEKEDFKSILQTTYQKLPKTIEDYWQEYETEEERENDKDEFYSYEKKQSQKQDDDKNYYEIERFEFTFDASYKLRNTFKVTKQKRKLVKIKIDNGFGFLLDLFYTLPTTEIKRLSNQLQTLFKIHQFALALLERGAVVPTIFSNQKNEIFIRWQPAVLNTSVKETLHQIASSLDIRSVNLGLRHKKEGDEKAKMQPHYADQQESTLTILGMILQFYIEETWIKTRYKKRLSSLNMKVESIFFMNLAMSFTGYQEKDMPHLIRAWLGKFLLSERKYVPILSIQENFEEGDPDEESIHNDYEEADETFSLEILIEDKEHNHKHEEEKTPHIPLAVIFEDDSFEDVRLPIVQDLQILSDFLGEIREIIESQGQETKNIESTRLAKILTDIFPVLQILGIKILLPKRLEKIVRPKLKATINSKNKKEESFLKLGSVWDFDWEVAMGEDKMSAADFERMIAQKAGLWRFKDQYVLLDEKEIALIVEQLKKKKKKLSNAELLQTALTEEYQGTKVELSEKVRILLNELKETPKIETPQNLKATLRPYQQVGYEWLYQNARLGLGSILADDMGLGKTLQTITFLLKLKEERQLGGQHQPALAVLPTTLLSNWQREIEKFAPSLSYHVYHGANRKWLDEKDIFQADIWLTTYGTVRSEDKRFAEREWACVIIDEAQAIKNPAAGQTEAVKMLKSPRKIALSGTPVENRLSEYWSIFDFVNENYLDVLSTFRTNFSIPIERDRDEHRADIFKKMTAPFIMRRLKTDKSIIDDLPEKIEKDQICSLTKEQTLLYETTLREGMKVVEENEGIKRRGVILKLMMQLKQICNHPAHFLKESTMKVSDSGKTKLFLDIVKQIYEAEEKALIFTQYTKMGELLKSFLQNTFQTEVPFLHGGLTRKGRDEAVEIFQNEEHCPFMILSLKAGGTGLNLTSASHVIHFDLWWNPAVEAQATDRAYRIGQKNNVLVHRMITQGTLEEKINTLLQSKKEIADLAITTNNAWITEMNTGELHELFSLKDL